MSLKKPLGKRLSSIRKMRGFTQSVLATKAGVDYRHYQDIEAGKVNTSFQTIDSLANALSIKACYLLDFQNESLLEHFNILCPIDLLSKLDCGVQIIDKEGAVHFNNSVQRKMLPPVLSERKEKIKVWEMAFSEEDQANIKNFLKMTMEGNLEPKPFATNYMNSEGSSSPVTLRWNYLFGKKKEVLGIVCIVLNNNQ